jgi:hypothetical protein
MRLVDEYIEQLPEGLQPICKLIRHQVLQLVPAVEEKFSFGIPFYHYFGMFLYLNCTAEGIAVCFCRGKDLLAAFPQLQQKNRAIVASIILKEKKDILRLELNQIIIAAAEWNKEAKKRKIPMVKRKTAAGKIKSRRS